MEGKVKKIVAAHLSTIKDGIIRRMAEQGRTATGRTAASLSVVARDDGGALYGNRNLLYIERGRGPGKVPKNFRAIIRDWIVARGIRYDGLTSRHGNREQGLDRLSFIIAKSIIDKGTRLYREKGYNDIYSTLLEEETEKTGDELSEIASAKIDSITAEYNANKK